MGTTVNKDLQQYLNLSYAQYPVTNPVGIRWIPTKYQTDELYEFLEFANITKSPKDFYRRNPGFFYPEQCYGYGSNNTNYSSPFPGKDDSNLPRRNFTAIGYIKNNNQVERDVIEQLKIMFKEQQQQMPGVYHNYQFIGFNTMNELNSYVRNPEYTFDPKLPGLCFAFWIQKLSDTRFDISLMFNDQFDSDYAGSGIPRQANVVWDPIRPQANIQAFYKYMNSGYSIMQNLIANTILRQVTNQTAQISMISVPQNQQPYTTDPLIESVLINWLPLATLIAYLFPVYRITQRMVAEKETQVRDSMRMMGLNEIAYWTSWFLYYLIINIIVSSACTFMLFKTLFKYSQPGIIWLFFFMYGLSLFGFITFIQAFFQNSRTSSVFAAILYGALYLINILVQTNDISSYVKNWASLIPQVALALMVPHMGAFEAAGIGLNTKNFNIVYNNYQFTNGYLMLLLDFVIYTILGIYIDNVYPRESGMQKPLSYGFNYLRASYWNFFDLCSCSKRKSSQKYVFLRDAAKRKAELEDHDFLTFETKYIVPDSFEPPDITLQTLEKKRRFLKIIDLKKQFNNGLKAVDGINIRMYEGQIFALLGHNGAGKTTTIQMMIGMLEPSEGEAFVYGYRVFSQGDMDTLRRYMGVCPQHNVLFDLLTPYETIRVFQDFKGAQGTRSEKVAETEKLLKDVGIWDYKNTIGKNLSGGNKRKLSVAIALCGNSKFVMLDEPTAGMDLQSRRNLWNMLRAYRNERIIVLTTHYMDEADVLGDRIGIMQNGRLVTVGSSLFLKKRFGVGYNFTFEKNLSQQFEIEKIDSYLKSQLSPEIKLLSNQGGEFTYQVPIECSEKFQNFFADFDQKLVEMQIQGYGISVTSLEEVFLRVGSQDTSIPLIPHLLKDNVLKEEIDNEIKEFSVANQSHSTNFCPNLRAIFYKRSILERRRWKQILLYECLVPILFVLIGIWLTQIKFFFDSPSRQLQTKLYPLPQRILMNVQPIVNSSLNVWNVTYADDRSIPIIVDDFPTSYTLLSENDFEVSFNNYTDDYLDGMDIYQNFNNDTYEMRTYNATEPYRFGSYLVYQADLATQQYMIINYLNTTSQDVAALYPQFMYESILRAATNQSNFQFKVTTVPFPISQQYRDQEQQTSTKNLIFVIAIGLSIIPANIIGAIMRERVSNLKHLQLISGLNLVAYHLTNILIDIIKAEFIVGACSGLFVIWKLKQYYWAILTICLWPFAVIPITHAISFMFKSEWSAQFFVIILNFITLGLIPYLVSAMFFNQSYLYAESINTGCLVLPGYSLSRALLFTGYQDQILRFRKSIGQDHYSQEVWTPGNFNYNLFAVLIQFWLGLLLVIIFDVIGCTRFIKFFENISDRFLQSIQKNVFKKKSFGQVVQEHEDDDVQNETLRVQSLNNDDLQVRVHQLSKMYTVGFQKILAVKKASFGLDFGECFALLGVNGAGKTTIFKSLTNETHPTSGQVSIGGYDIARDFSKARKLIGFCPQENVLFEFMTVEEHLFFYSLLKGIPNKIRRKIIEYTIKEMDLVEQRKKISKSLSGGNKRKLQVAIAIIGNPPIVLLDEPSAGMDPQARRFMWRVIAELNKKQEKCAVILTTHSMEEAEALGTKLGIMVKGGKFRCFGSSQHLKNKFGTGFEVEIKIIDITPESYKTYLQYFSIPDNISKITLIDAIERMRAKNFPEELLSEIRSTGLGDELIRESKLDSGANVRVKHLIEWAHNMKFGMRVVRNFAKEFGQVTLLEQYSDFFKIRFQMNEKSIGHVFGEIEQKKEFLGIQEYSVSQSTLEQIFQMFANSKRADENEVEELQKITFDYTKITDQSEFELIITKNQQ